MNTVKLAVYNQSNLVQALFEAEKITYDHIENYEVSFDDDDDSSDEEEEYYPIYGWYLIDPAYIEKVKEAKMVTVEYKNIVWVAKTWYGCPFYYTREHDRLIKLFDKCEKIEF